MNKFIFGVGFLVVAVLIGMALLTALASASASLANGVANAAASTALMTSECISGFMILVALVAGGAIGASLVKMQALFSKPQMDQRWVSGPNAGWKKLEPPAKKALPSVDDLAVLHQLRLLQEARSIPRLRPTNTPEDDENDDFRTWGW